MVGCGEIPSGEDDVEMNWPVLLPGFRIDISLTEAPELADEIENALTIESAEMVLLTLRRVDEVILVAPHMVPAWKKLLDRLVQLDPENALKYVTEMSLHWNPRYADIIIAEHEGRIFSDVFQRFSVFILGTQAVGNELDTYGMKIWAELTLSRLSRESLPDIISSLLDIFPTSFFSKGYSRTLHGVLHTNYQFYINPDFCKKVAETLLLLIGEYMQESPLMAVAYIIPSAIRILRRGIDMEMMERYFSSWKQGVGIIAEEDVDGAMRILAGREDNPFLETHKDDLEMLKQNLSTRTAIAENKVSTLGHGWRGPYSAVRKWYSAVDDAMSRSDAIQRWRKDIEDIAKRDPASAIDAIYASIEPFQINIIEEGAEGNFTHTIQEVLSSIMDAIFGQDILRGLALCDIIFKKKSLIITSISKTYLFDKILQYIPSIESSHPDLALSLYWHMDYALSRGSFEEDYFVDKIERHQKILESVIGAATINLLESIRGCEHILIFSQKDSAVYLQALSLWRKYMNQLEKRHAKTAGDRYSDFHAALRFNPEYEDIACESDAGYERCLKTRKLQACTSSPFAPKQNIITIGSPEN